MWQVDERFFFEFWHGDGDARYATASEQISLPMTELDLADLHRLLGSTADGTDERDVAPPKAQRGLRALISRLSR